MGMQTVADGRETLRHEVLGHYGLNTFKSEDKKAILQRIINSKKKKLVCYGKERGVNTTRTDTDTSTNKDDTASLDNTSDKSIA